MAHFFFKPVLLCMLAIACFTCFVDAVPVNVMSSFNAANFNVTRNLAGKKEIMVWSSIYYLQICADASFQDLKPFRLSMPTPLGTVMADFPLAPVASEYHCLSYTVKYELYCYTTRNFIVRTLDLLPN
jgi:hypothetical protein